MKSPTPPLRNQSELTPKWENFLLRQDISALKRLIGMAYGENKALREENARLQELAFTDELTGLHNLRYWNKWSAEIWPQYKKSTSSNDNDRRRHGDLVLAFIDVNGLGRINKDYGDHVGDALIKHAAETLSSSFRRASDKKHFSDSPDHIIARKGGDELVMLLPEASVEFLSETMEKINQSPAFNCDGLAVNMRCSYGLSIKSPSKTLEEALIEADLKMQIYKETAHKSKVIAGSALQLGQS